MRRPVSRATTLTRWIGSTLAFVGVGLVNMRFGHWAALATMLALLLVVYFLGGSGSSGSYGDSGATEAQVDADTETSDGSGAAGHPNTVDVPSPPEQDRTGGPPK